MVNGFRGVVKKLHDVNSIIMEISDFLFFFCFVGISYIRGDFQIVE